MIEAKDIMDRLKDIRLKDTSQWFNIYVVDMLNLIDKKNADYTGQSEDFLKNFRGGGMKGIVARLNDKFMRVVHLLKNKEAAVTSESFRDTCLDASNYFALLCYAYETGMSLEGDLWTE